MSCVLVLVAHNKKKKKGGTQWTLIAHKTRKWTKGYKDVVVHVSFLQVLHDGLLCDFGQQDHVVHAALLHILTLPVIFSLNDMEERGSCRRVWNASFLWIWLTVSHFVEIRFFIRSVPHSTLIWTFALGDAPGNNNSNGTTRNWTGKYTLTT